MTSRLTLPLMLSALAALSGCATRAPVPEPVAAKDQRPAEYQPKRAAASAMQAWIAPWEDATGDLYPPSTVYIEVLREHWHYDGTAHGRLTVLRPLQVQPRSPAPSGPPVMPPDAVGADPAHAPVHLPREQKRGA
ncbi:TraV family lipoprotein [Thiocapsa bogorovii]|uniref:TraV family lipoprotein n=1 Tax=Thiocapsa bogorovii TaxID=521689 RepID=UPI001E5BC979|nr:TraV family lipoprotein [Thiocapsa bogorovii]UHD16324.1 TraV family lipoprotein [Thiocapsa bogorovii]